MKKMISIFAIVTFLTVLIFTGNSYAAALDTIDVQTDKTTVRPGEEVKVTVQFGQDLGKYTFNVAYDNNIFDYVSAEGGTASDTTVNDTTSKVQVAYDDTANGTSPKTNMSVTFRAKADLTTSNPTEFTITADDLANADGTTQFDAITTPIVKNVTVEPVYVDYTLKLEHTGEIIKEEEKAMTLSYSSPMGRYYEHARLIAEATTPAGATVQLLATDQASLEHDIIQSGWGDAQGYKIGGKDVSQVLQTKAIFNQAGDYTITLKLIDRDNSDQVIVEKAFPFTVLEEATPVTPVVPERTEPTTPEEPEVEEVNPEETPKKLPKTGSNLYIPVIVVLIALISSYVYFNKKK